MSEQDSLIVLLHQRGFPWVGSLGDIADEARAFNVAMLHGEAWLIVPEGLPANAIKDDMRRLRGIAKALSHNGHTFEIMYSENTEGLVYVISVLHEEL